MQTLTRCLLAQSIFLYAALAHSAADPGAAISDCRARHAENPTEHIACLERELRALGGASQESARPDIGAEQLQKKGPQETFKPVAVQIANVVYGLDGVGQFQMTDGQVWKATQSTPREQRLEPGKSYAARIERGSLGGYKLYVDGVRQMIRVMRIQ